jgi:hypothetical protein
MIQQAFTPKIIVHTVASTIRNNVQEALHPADKAQLLHFVIKKLSHQLKGRINRIDQLLTELDNLSIQFNT